MPYTSCRSQHLSIVFRDAHSPWAPVLLHHALASEPEEGRGPWVSSIDNASLLPKHPCCVSHPCPCWRAPRSKRYLVTTAGPPGPKCPLPTSMENNLAVSPASSPCHLQGQAVPGVRGRAAAHTLSPWATAQSPFMGSACHSEPAASFRALLPAWARGMNLWANVVLRENHGPCPTWDLSLELRQLSGLSHMRDTESKIRETPSKLPAV